MRGVRGKVLGWCALVLLLSCGRTSIDDPQIFEDGTIAGSGGQQSMGGSPAVGGTQGIAGSGGKRPNNAAGAGGRPFGGGGRPGFGGDLPTAGTPFGGQPFGGAGGVQQGGTPFGGAHFAGQGGVQAGAPFGGQAFGGAPFGGEAGAGGVAGSLGGAGFGGVAGTAGNAGSAGMACASESCPNCKPGICAPNLSNCAFTNDLALAAEASATHGGIGGYGPGQLNDGVGQGQTCHWAWVDNNTSSSNAYFELDWPSPVKVQSIYVDTGNAAGEPVCPIVTGRNLLSGELQYWNGADWSTAQTWDGQLDDFVISLPAPITTTKLRLFDVRTSPGNGNSLIFELYVAAGPACGP